MGVSGSGKSTIGKLLSTHFNIPFFDADDYHPPSNIEKMSQGNPLTDADRLPWLESLKALLQEQKEGAVLACSALKESYRKVLETADSVHWIYLKGSMELIQSRMRERNDHFMKSSMLASQFEALEEPNYGHHISIQGTEKEILKSILVKLENE